ncbi:alpha/beta-Hydrolases superfamily protein [Zea mays]|uniref:Alpha/beta-Hydrolases superfamily protein n=1 Tax=Zea mays TaxID=4577 RepID=A0A1D6NQU8_MAIZE|nr:alpha/beta-Hydrolases superfamily protein [Zea mays]
MKDFGKGRGQSPWIKVSAHDPSAQLLKAHKRSCCVLCFWAVPGPERAPIAIAIAAMSWVVLSPRQH